MTLSIFFGHEKFQHKVNVRVPIMIWIEKQYENRLRAQCERTRYLLVN